MKLCVCVWRERETNSWLFSVVAGSELSGGFCLTQQCQQLHSVPATQCTPTLLASKDSLSFCIFLLIKVLTLLCDGLF